VIVIIDGPTVFDRIVRRLQRERLLHLGVRGDEDVRENDDGDHDVDRVERQSRATPPG
jgi:hypothetical protein